MKKQYIYIQITSFSKKTHNYKAYNNISDAIKYVNEKQFEVEQVITDAAGNVTGLLVIK